MRIEVRSYYCHLEATHNPTISAGSMKAGVTSDYDSSCRMPGEDWNIVPVTPCCTVQVLSACPWAQ